MTEIFNLYLEAGIFGSILIAVILVARLFLRQAPRRILCIVWLLAVLRLLVPFQIESMFSLQPKQLSFYAAVQEESVMPSFSNPNAPAEVPVVTPQPDTQDIAPVPEPSPAVDYIQIVAIVWGAVACGFMLYGIISFLIFKIKVRDAVKQPDGTKECANINNAFLIGLFCPVIYLPVNLAPQERELIITHEKTHIAQGDNWWKILSFLCLCLHWYNPLVWVSFHLMNKDIEIACDEKVVRDLDTESRKAYSLALLSFGKRSCVPYMPSSSFGKVNLKQRLQYILSYKKPQLWISVAAILLTVVIGVCFLTSPQHKDQNPQQDLQASGTPTPTETQPEVIPEKPTEDTTTPTEPVQETDPPTEPEPSAPPVTEPPSPPVTEPTAPPATEPPAPQVTQPTPPVTEDPDPPPSNIHNFDLGTVDANTTNYAASLGFQTLDSHPNTNVAHFRTSCAGVPNLTLSQLLETAYGAVDMAYRHCIDKQYPVSTAVLWVNITYLGYMGNYVIDVYCAV